MHVTQGELRVERIAPEDVGLTRAPREQLQARDLAHASELCREILSGKERGPARDMTLLNAAAALLVADRSTSWQEAIGMARQAIDSGRASSKLDALVTSSNA